MHPSRFPPQIEVPLLARRPTPAVIHTQAVEFGSVTDDKKVHGTVKLVNNGSRKACFTIKWDEDLPLVFSPAEVSVTGLSGAWIKAKSTGGVGTIRLRKGSPCF